MAENSLERDAACGCQRRLFFSVKTGKLVAKMGHTLGCGKQMCSEKLPVFRLCMIDSIFFKLTCLIKLELCFQKE